MLVAVNTNVYKVESTVGPSRHALPSLRVPVQFSKLQVQSPELRVRAWN